MSERILKSLEIQLSRFDKSRIVSQLKRPFGRPSSVRASPLNLIHLWKTKPPQTCKHTEGDFLPVRTITVNCKWSTVNDNKRWQPANDLSQWLITVVDKHCKWLDSDADCETASRFSSYSSTTNGDSDYRSRGELQIVRQSATAETHKQTHHVDAGKHAEQHRRLSLLMSESKRVAGFEWNLNSRATLIAAPSDPDAMLIRLPRSQRCNLPIHKALFSPARSMIEKAN